VVDQCVAETDHEGARPEEDQPDNGAHDDCDRQCGTESDRGEPISAPARNPKAGQPERNQQDEKPGYENSQPRHRGVGRRAGIQEQEQVVIELEHARSQGRHDGHRRRSTNY